MLSLFSNTVGGVGKTMITAAVTRDLRVRSAFEVICCKSSVIEIEWDSDAHVSSNNRAKPQSIS